MIKRPVSKRQLADLWSEEYCDNELKCCGLCGNYGIIERGMKKYWCICPNGRVLRKNGDKRPPQ